MQELLVLCHRIPYPPDKGDKIRSWNFVRHLAERHRVLLGCFIDDQRDWVHTDFLRGICEECFFADLAPRRGRIRAVRGLLDGRPITLPYYFNAQLDRWVRGALSRPGLDRVFVYCSAMAQYVPMEVRRSRRCVADLVDVDSEKWRDYAQRGSPLRRWLWRRESVKLRQVEREIVETFAATLVATPAELELLRSVAPAASEHMRCVANGVDSAYFSPDRPYEVPPNWGGTPLVFTGAMDYWPNADAAEYFARAILPRVRQRVPDARFFVVGANPTPTVAALAEDARVVVTGWVQDIRPYIKHAKAVVAPLRIARGVQNKVLEGMAMGKPVIASRAALTGIAADIGREVLAADTPDDFADAVCRATMSEAGDAIGRRARRRVIAEYAWTTALERLDAAVDG